MFISIKDKIQLCSDYSIINIKCFSCHQDNHVVKNCPKLHANTNKEIYIKNVNLNNRRIIRTLKRRKKDKFNALKNIDEVRISSDNLRNFIDYYLSRKKIKNIELNLIHSINNKIIHTSEEEKDDLINGFKSNDKFSIAEEYASQQIEKNHNFSFHNKFKERTQTFGINEVNYYNTYFFQIFI